MRSTSTLSSVNCRIVAVSSVAGRELARARVYARTFDDAPGAGGTRNTERILGRSERRLTPHGDRGIL